MKLKATAALLAALIVFAACAGTPKGPDELDLAIRDASDYLNDNIPAKSKIVILNIQSDSAALSEYIIDELNANAVNDRIFEVVDRQQLDLIRTEQDFQWSGEVDDKSALAIGNFFGAQFIVSGKVNRVGERYRFSIRALDVKTARLQGQNNTNINASPTLIALLRGKGLGSGTSSNYAAGGNRGSSGTVIESNSTAGSSSNNSKQTPSKQTGPANGTYTLWPRPQAYDSGVAVKNVFLAQIVYTNEFTIMYFARSAQGTFTDGIGGTSTYCWQEWKTLQLQDLDNPTKFYTPVNADQNNNGGGGIYWISFKRLPVKRFKLVANSWNDLQTFYEVIIPDQPDE